MASHETKKNNKMKQTVATKKGVNYEAFKKEALNHEFATRKVKIKDIEFEPNGELIVEGVKVRTSEKVKKNFVKNILKISPSTVKQVRQFAGADTEKNLMEIIKTGIATLSKNDTVNILGNPTTGVITNIIPGNQDVISNRLALETFEKMMNSNSKLSVVEAELKKDGAMILNVRANIQKEVHAGGKHIKGETYNPGFSFANLPLKGLEVSHYVTRLVCTNGMTSRFDLGSGGSLSKLNDEEIRKFFLDFMKMSQNDFEPKLMADKIAKAIETPASFHEILTARSIMLSRSILPATEIDAYLPQFGIVSKQLASKGVDYAACSDAQLQNYATPFKVWDVVNELTEFGSHDFGYKADSVIIQKLAGDILNKKVYDTENVLTF